VSAHLLVVTKNPILEAARYPKTVSKHVHYLYVPVNPYSAEALATYRKKLFARRAHYHQNAISRPGQRILANIIRSTQA
jgi:hypothetical protein